MGRPRRAGSGRTPVPPCRNLSRSRCTIVTRGRHTSRTVARHVDERMNLTETLDDPGGVPADTPRLRGPSRGASPGFAAILSLVFPGLGQMMAGAARRGLLV